MPLLAMSRSLKPTHRANVRVADASSFLTPHRSQGPWCRLIRVTPRSPIHGVYFNATKDSLCHRCVASSTVSLTSIACPSAYITCKTITVTIHSIKSPRETTLPSLYNWTGHSDNIQTASTNGSVAVAPRFLDYCRSSHMVSEIHEFDSAGDGSSCQGT